ncbi:hypothetical protein [Alkaliphilus transvaalensis]|uniref:hypothetical protein n=1 Tax=Alkaliphilus transvaalensis TaxID=114628 RepID=UPI00047E59C3|nr:hypothetical protein [Alkaliphilus transvaalensis]
MRKGLVYLFLTIMLVLVALNIDVFYTPLHNQRYYPYKILKNNQIVIYADGNAENLERLETFIKNLDEMNEDYLLIMFVDASKSKINKYRPLRTTEVQALRFTDGLFYHASGNYDYLGGSYYLGINKVEEDESIYYYLLSDCENDNNYLFLTIKK